MASDRMAGWVEVSWWACLTRWLLTMSWQWWRTSLATTPSLQVLLILISVVSYYSPFIAGATAYPRKVSYIFIH